MSTVSSISIPEIRNRLSGQVIVPEDPKYDQARALFYAKFDRRPAVIIRPTDADEVAFVVSLARENGVELAVRSGGHSTAGHSVSEGGIVRRAGLGRSEAILAATGDRPFDLERAVFRMRVALGLTAGGTTVPEAA